MEPRLRTDAASTVFEAFKKAARVVGNRPFLAVLPETAASYQIPSGEISYADLARQVEQLVVLYRTRGYGHGHRVGILIENRPAFFSHWFALNALGVSVVPINPDLRRGELQYLIEHSEIVAVLAIPSRRTDVLNAASAVSPGIVVFTPDEEPGVIVAPFPIGEAPSRGTECALLYTSGTTGRPKGCVLTNEYFLYAGQRYAAAKGLIAMSSGAERMLTALPLFHMNAMAYSTMAMVQTGGCLIPLDRFHPRTWWSAVRDSKATIVHYLGVMPPLLLAAAPAPDDKVHDVRFGFGAGVDRKLHTQFEERFGFPLIEAWAMTETGAGAVIMASQEPRHVGTNCFGRATEEMELKIVTDDGVAADIEQPGELLVRHGGPDPRYGFFREYLKEPEATARAWTGGWFHTGDIVRQSPDRSLHFVDRKKNVIRRSGENVSATEVENILAQHPAVAYAAVAPTPDPLRGDEVFACIVARSPPVGGAAQSELARSIVSWCLAQLAYYKAPGYVAFIPEIPVTSTQKIRRDALKELICSIMESSSHIDTRDMKKRK